MTVVLVVVSVAPAVANASPTVLTTVPGVIEDATSTRVLYRPPGDQLQPLKVRDATTGTEVTVPVRAGREVLNNAGRLFDGGVLFFTTTVGGDTTGGELDEWRTGTAASIPLGDATASSLAVAGNFAIWNDRGGSTSTLTRRDLTLATNTTVATDSGNTSNDVAANGDVVFWDSVEPFEVHRWRNSIRTKLSDAPSPAWSTYPVTDGINTVYRRTPPCCVGGTRSIAFSDGTTETVLPGSDVSFEDPNPGRDYAAAAGWIAYTRNSRAEVWLRAPAGTFTEVSADGGTEAASIVHLAEGQVAYSRRFGQLFLAAPGHRPFPTGLDSVEAFRQGDRWYAFSSSELMRIGTDTVITAAPPAATDDPVAHFEFASTSRDPTYECKLDGNTVPCGADEEYTTPTLGDGSHTFTVASTDPDLDETDSTPASATWTLDTTPPAAFDLLAPADNAGVGSGPELSWSAAADGSTGSGIASYAVTIDGEQVGTTAANVTTFTAPPRAEGPHTWRVRATDNAGNTRDSGIRTYIVDVTPPSQPNAVRPAQSAVVDSRPTLEWERAEDGGSGVVGYDVELDGALTRVTGADTTSFTPAGALAEGHHEWRVWAIDGAGNRTQGSARSFQVDTRPPVAGLTASPNPALAGTRVRFDAGGSAPVANPLARFEWDLDGNGSFETDTGGTPTAERTYSTPQDVEVTVRATDTAGRSDTETVALSVTPAPLPGPPGISINDGARFTNDPDVTLTARWPSFATRMLISNDGGFPGAEPQPVSTLVPWRLDSSGAERLPTVVYVRFLGGLAGNESYQDDIVLDQTAPRILSATLSGGRRLRPNSGLRRFTVRGRATDRTSGLGYLQLTSDRKHPGGKRRYRRAVSLAAKRAPRWIRVIDKAGNRSGWRKLKATGR